MADLTADPGPGDDEEAITDADDVLATGAPVSALVEPDQGWIADDEATVVATEAGGDVGSLSQEESAIHLVGEDDDAGLNWDEAPGYVDEQPSEQPQRFGDT